MIRLPTINTEAGQETSSVYLEVRWKSRGLRNKEDRKIGKMIFVWLSLLALSGTAFAQRNPNPCEDVPDRTFVNDYARCEWYFWCNNGQAFVAPPCEEGWGFEPGIEGTGVCDFDSECNNDEPPCPVDGNNDPVDIAVGVGDADCRQYTFCVDGIRATHAVPPAFPVDCGFGLRFNRITGMCDVPANVVCPEGGSGGGISSDCVRDEVLFTGDVNSLTSCAAFRFCNNGTISDEEFFCSPPLHFNPTPGRCDLPTNLAPPCVDPPTLVKRTVHVPRAPHVKREVFE